MPRISEATAVKHFSAITQFLTAVPTLEQPASPTVLPPLSEDDFSLMVHPDGELYVGDLVSLEVIASDDADINGRSIQVEFNHPQGERLEKVDFDRFGIGGRPQATMRWGWNTSKLDPGEHHITFTIHPEEITWTETISILPQDELPPIEANATWKIAESECCLVNYISGTEAERDLPQLLEIIDSQAARVSENLGTANDEPILVTILPRVLGHGGFSGKEISVSYLDRNYAGSNTEIILRHEMVHALDSQLGGDLRPTLLIEGLAVYLAGGHFKQEPLTARAATLLSPTDECKLKQYNLAETQENDAGCGLDWYIPLSELLDDFYFSHHEIGYLQAGALVEFMVERWGWDAFSNFYRNIHPIDDSDENVVESYNEQARAMNAALREHFGISLEELEKLFLDYLGDQELQTHLVEDVRFTVEFYETVRRYQLALDPSAYFLNAWLLDGEEMRDKGIVADYLRHPSLPENIAIETMLAAANDYLKSGDFSRVEYMLAAVNAVLDVIELEL
jgi:hypothetical protein